MPERIDTLISADWVIPVEPRDAVLANHAVAIRAGRIIAVLPQAESRQIYNAAEEVALGAHVLLPGLINLHTHAAMSLLRGLADDLCLMDWLKNHIWPAERHWVSSEFVHDGALLACAEMLRGGITCFNDMYFFPEDALRAVHAAKMRATLGMIVVEAETAYAKTVDEYLNKGLALHDDVGDDARVKTVWAPHAPYTIGDATFEKILTFASELNLGIHTHVHETHDEIEQSIRQYSLRPLQRLRQLGVLGPNLIAVHAVHLSEREIADLAAFGAHVVHCPASNLKLASGIAPIPGLIDAGVNIGLGTDGAASNNRLDLWGEMRLAALLAKGAAKNPLAVPAHQALRMATINAARALDRDGEIGSLEVGKQADIIAVDLGGLEMTPCYDVASQLVYVASRRDVSHVWIGGELLVDGGILTQLDSQAIQLSASRWQRKIAASG